MNDASTDPIQLLPSYVGEGGTRHVFALLLIAVVVIIVGYFDLGQRDLLNSLETGYAVTVQEMVRDGHWIVPSLNDRPRLVKPPLPFWISAGVCKIIHGDTAPLATLRAVSVMISIFAAWLVYALGCRMFDRRAALWAAIVWATCFLVVYETRYARHDIYLVASVHLAMLGIFKFWQRERFGFLITLAGLALAFQCKGPVSWALTVLPAVVFALTRRPIRWKFIGGLVAAMLLGGATLLPWVFAVQQQLGIDAYHTWRWESIGRFASEHAPFVPPWFYLQFVGYVAPWTVYFIAAMVVPFERKYAARREPMLFAWLWLVVALVFMSLPYEKTGRYVVPLVAPAALLIGQVLSFHIDLWRRKLIDAGARAVWGAHVMLLLGMAISLPALAVSHYQLDPLVALTLGAVALCPAVVTGLALVMRRNALAGTNGSAITAGVVLIAFFTANQYSPLAHDDLPEKAPLLNQAVPANATIISWPAQPPLTLVYHANRPIPTITHWAQAKALLADHPELRLEDLRQKKKVFARTMLQLWLDDHVGQTVYVMSDSARRDYVSQQAQERGMHVDFAADLTTPKPRKDELRELYLLRLSPQPPDGP